MAETADLKSLARRVLQRDTARDSERDRLSRQGETLGETARQYHRLNPAPVSPVSAVSGVSPVSGVLAAPVCIICHATGSDVGTDTASGVPVHERCRSRLPNPLAYRVQIIEVPFRTRYAKVFGTLQVKCPNHVPEGRWRQCLEDGKRFLTKWGESAERLGWSSADLFGLHTPPDEPRSSYQRLSRYDCMGLCWALQGREVIALTAEGATIRAATGNTLTFYRQRRPALGPLGDCLEDFVYVAVTD